MSYILLLGIIHTSMTSIIKQWKLASDLCHRKIAQNCSSVQKEQINLKISIIIRMLMRMTWPTCLALLQVGAKESRLLYHPRAFDFQSRRQKRIHAEKVHPSLSALDCKWPNTSVYMPLIRTRKPKPQLMDGGWNI